MSLDNNCLQMGKTCKKYHIYSITNVMANTSADKMLYSSSHLKRRLKKKKIIFSNVTIVNGTFCPSKNDTIAA